MTVMEQFRDQNTIRILSIFCVSTCIYIPAAIILLMFFDNLYNIGKFSCYYMLLGLVLAEFNKHMALFLSGNVQTKGKVKTKKSTGVRAFLKSILVIVAITGIYYFVTVLFGAQILEEQEQTLMFSLLLTVLTVIPSCLNLGTDTTVDIFSDLAMFKGDLLSEFTLRNIRCTLIGAWMGAIVIPLDWDRPWQEWPVSCCLGALGGYVFAHVLTLCMIILKSSVLFKSKTGKYGL